jgi:MYXO-CTERM domain-containing protein
VTFTLPLNCSETVFSFSSPAAAANYTATSCAVSDIEATVSSAKDGDTVRVPGGSCTWMTVLTISKGITLDGQGVADVTFGSGAGLTLNTDAVASSVVTGFTFHNGFINGSYPISIITTSAPFNAPFRIYNNSLSDDGHQGGPVTLIGVSGFGPGLIDHDTFTTANGADEVIHLLGSGSPSDASGWSNDVVPGGSNMTFLENVVFKNTSGTTTTSAEEAYYGAQMVFRHNVLSFEGNDIHQGGLSGRWAEIYDNTYELTGVNLPNYWQFRGGSGLVYDNTSSGAPCCDDPYPSAQFGPDCPGSSDDCMGAWPIPTQVGTGIHETTSSPVYVWGNESTIDGSMQSIQDSLYYTNGTQAGGTPTSCTHPGGICDVVVTASAPSSWVRCESAADLSAGCPVSYTYTPYPYPHPLDNLSASCVGVGCPAAASGSDAGTDAGVDAGGDGGRGKPDASVRPADASSDVSTSDGSRLARGAASKGGCSCRAVPERAGATGTTPFLAAGLASLFRRRRRHPHRQLNVTRVSPSHELRCVGSSTGATS